MLSFGFLNRNYGGGSSGKLNIVTAEVSQDGTKVIITYDGTPDPYAYDINIMIGGITDGNLAANIVGNSIEWVVLNTIKKNDVVTVNIMAQGNINQVNNYPVTNLSMIAASTPPDIDVDSAFTSSDGNSITVLFNDPVVGAVSIDEFLITSDQGIFTLGSISVLDDTMEIEVTPPIINTDTNIVISFAKTGNSNITDFTNHPVANAVPNSAPLPPIDLDNDDKPDTIIYDNPPVLITEDDDSYQADINGNGEEDIHIDKEV